jgi:L-seryl-tRNA(Ser) seleniumtransferase
VDWFLKQDDEEMQKEFRGRAERIANGLRGIPTLQSRIIVPPVANHVPHLLISYDPDRLKILPREVMERLRQGRPRIELNPATGGGSASKGLPSNERTLVVGVWMMQPGEDLIVARRLREVLEGAAA